MHSMYLLYSFVWLLIFLAGHIWWVGLLQQKEYRLDRLLAHLRSLSLQQGIVHILPVITLGKPKQFKRPVKTLRSLLLLFASILFSSMLVIVTLPWTQSVAALVTSRLLILPLFLYLISPAILLFFTMITGAAVWLVTTYYLFRVRQVLCAKQMFVIGITGSFGKTTTKQLLTHVLSRKDEVFTTPGSVNTALGIARSLLQNLGNAKTLIIEYAAYCPGEIARLAAVIRPDMAILTGLGTQHIELFGSQQAIAEAKAELLAALPINAPVFCSNQSALAVTAAYTGKKPLRIIKTWSDESVQITTKIIGKHYTQTILTVMAVAQFLGLSQKHIVEKLQTFVPTEKWIRKRVGRSGAQVLDDGGTSNPDGFSAALSLLAEYELPRKILATAGIIDLGTEAAAIHTRLAKEATVDVSEVWYLGEVGKHEFLQAFGEKLITDRELIVEKIQALDAETILLLEGRLPMWLTELL